MTAEEKSGSAEKGPILLPPWLVIIGALLLYLITLHHWVTFSSLPIVANLTGWDWHPIPMAWRNTQAEPLFRLLTCPLRVLPASWVPLLLNLFAAICGALTLGTLAASVRLLPHDRTREQRQREGGEFALLSMRAAFLPALFAVLMMALQLSFWRDAIAFSQDSLDTLVFAVLIFCLLKYRISQNDNWLFGFAFLYGLGTTNNWALIGFFPLFLIALIWIRGISFFSPVFLGRIIGCGFLGLLLYLLIPIIGSLSSDRANFMDVLHLELGAQSFGLHSVPRWIALVAALPTILPLLFAGIKWPSFEGELSAAGNALTKLMFRLLHVFFLLLAVVLFLDLKYSPSLRMAEAPTSFLTFYYLGALCIGYFSGYVLLVFGKPAGQSWERTSLPAMVFNRIMVAALVVVAVGSPVWLFAKNIPHILAGQAGFLMDYSDEIMRDLPDKPAIILSDDPTKIYLLDAAYARAGKPNKNIMIETASFPYKEYIAHLLSRYPDLKKITPAIERFPRAMSGELNTQYLYTLSRHYSVYYLHPSFGYYFETFYPGPRGLVYELQPYPKEAIDQPPLTTQEIQENEAVWSRIEKSTLANLPDKAKLDPNAGVIARDLSVALDTWGVLLEKNSLLAQAGANFTQAVKFNPQNFMAKINLEYNGRLQKKDPRPINTEDIFYKAAALYGNLLPILKYNGPTDEPGVLSQVGQTLAAGHDYRSAAILFKRRLQLLPGDVEAQLALAKLFVDSSQPDRAAEMIAKLHANPAAKKWDVARVEALADLNRNETAAAEKLLVASYNEAPQDQDRVATLADFYRVCGFKALRDAAQAEAKKDEAARKKFEAQARLNFTNTLIYLDRQLQVLTAVSHNSSDPYGVPGTLMTKAEVQMRIGDFKGAVSSINKILDLQPKNVTAMFNRAMAEIQLKQFTEAKEDYKTLRKMLPKQTYLADYGLAEIASLEKDSTEELRLLKRYMETAPDDTQEFQLAKARLRKLESH